MRGVVKLVRGFLKTSNGNICTVGDFFHDSFSQAFGIFILSLYFYFWYDLVYFPIRSICTYFKITVIRLPKVVGHTIVVRLRQEPFHGGTLFGLKHM